MNTPNHAALAALTLVTRTLDVLVATGKVSREEVHEIFDHAISDHANLGTDVNSEVAALLAKVREDFPREDP